MTNPLGQSLTHNFEVALRHMAAALVDCPDTLWEQDLWPEEAPTRPTDYGGLHGSAPWFLAYHSLLTADYHLVAEFEPWTPPTPFDENTMSFPNRVFTRDELLGYVDYCRERARGTLDVHFEEKAAWPLPEIHRHRGITYGVLAGGIPLHIVEHASQIRQFLTSAGVKVGPLPGDRGFATSISAG